MDEQPVKLLKATRTPIPATAQHGKRVDYECERAGTAKLFMFTESHWRVGAMWRFANRFLSEAAERIGASGNALRNCLLCFISPILAYLMLRQKQRRYRGNSLLH